MGLFEAFDKVSHQDWLDKITIDLKGKDFNDTLVWKSEEGIDVQPFYNSSSKTSTPLKETNQWKIRESIVIDAIKIANQKALLALKGGADSIQFIGEIKTQSDMDELLKNIQTELIEIHFYNNNPTHTSTLVSLNQGSISYDYLNHFSTTNEWLSELAGITNSTSNVKTINVSVAHNSIIHEVALSLNQAVEYLNLLTDKGIDVKTVASKIQFTFSVGTNYFFEIAKIRAARKLWQLILEQYNLENTSMTIHSETSIEENSDEDNNYNILRNTTKAMAAIIGGCDSLTVNPHDSNESSIDFSNRIARNIQHILKEEAFFDKVNNPADGAYYIEELTNEIANKAWKIFQEVEAEGGFLAHVSKNSTNV